MTERLILALAVLSALALVGQFLRAAATRRRRRLVEEVRLSVSAGPRPRVIAFSGPGCAACRTQQRILDEVRAAWAGGVDVEYVDAMAEPALARRFGVLVVPTTVVAAPDGRVVGINGGLADADRLLTQLAAAA
jgi:thioredoxin-like negative regulator of GroEL